MVDGTFYQEQRNTASVVGSPCSPMQFHERSELAPSIRSVLALQFFISFFATLMKRPKALSFFRLSRYDIP